MISLMRLAYATRSTDSYGRTDGRTNGDAWLRTRDHLTFRNARARIRDSRLALVRERADREAAS